MEKRDKKRLAIVAVYAVIFIGIAFLIYKWTRPTKTCFDGIKNQNEQGVDCGGVCAKNCPIKAKEKLIVRRTGFVEGGVVNNYDVFGEVNNPNITLGAGNFDYEFRVKDADGNLIAERKGKSFILPGDSKYLVETNIGSRKIPAGVELNVGNAEWVAANDYYERPALKVVNKNYNEISSGTGFAEATGLLKNESPFDFNSVLLRVIMADISGNIVAVNSTQMNTVKTGENRDFRVAWPNKFSGKAGNMNVQVEVNVFDSEAFFEKNFQLQKFQQLR